MTDRSRPASRPRLAWRAALAAALLGLSGSVGAAAVVAAEPAGGWGLMRAAGLLLAWLACLCAERVLVHAIRGLQMVTWPMIGGQEGASGRLSRYERSAFTLGSTEARWVLFGLLLAGIGLWWGWNGSLAATVVGLLAFTLALGGDLWTWECVEVSRWQLAWRRGWRRSVRRLPLVQVAEVHVIERRARLPGVWLSRHLSRPLGTSCLAVELHDGRALKLPRTALLSDGAAVEQVARHLQRHLRLVERQRRLATREQLRAMRRVRPAAADADERALRRELDLLRVQAEAARAVPPRVGRSLASGGAARPLAAP